MKRNEIDKKIGMMLKEEMPQAPQSEWFTRKVINRLPPKPAYRSTWLTVAMYLFCLVACLGGWALFFFSLTPGIILVKDAVCAAILLVVTSLLLWQAISNLLHASDI